MPIIYVLYLYVVSNIPGASNKLEQIQHRLMSFDDEWRTLRRWYLKFRNIGTVNSNLDTQAVYRTARDKIQEVINKVHKIFNVAEKMASGLFQCCMYYVEMMGGVWGQC